MKVCRGRTLVLIIIAGVLAVLVGALYLLRTGAIGQHRIPAEAVGLRVTIDRITRGPNGEVCISYTAHGLTKLGQGRSIGFGQADLRRGLGVVTLNSIQTVGHSSSTWATTGDSAKAETRIEVPAQVRRVTLQQEIRIVRPRQPLVFSFPSLSQDALPMASKAGGNKVIVRKLYANDHLSSGHMERKEVRPGVWEDHFVVGKSGPLNYGIEVDTDFRYGDMRLLSEELRDDRGRYHNCIAPSWFLYDGYKTGSPRYRRCVFIYQGIKPLPRTVDFTVTYNTPADQIMPVWATFHGVTIPP